MKKLFTLIFILSSSLAYAQQGGSGPHIVSESQHPLRHRADRVLATASATNTGTTVQEQLDNLTSGSGSSAYLKVNGTNKPTANYTWSTNLTLPNLGVTGTASAAIISATTSVSGPTVYGNVLQGGGLVGMLKGSAEQITTAVPNTDYEPAHTEGNITGTQNQISVTNGTGSVIGTGITLSTPQDIGIASNVQFDNITATTQASAPIVQATNYSTSPIVNVAGVSLASTSSNQSGGTAIGLPSIAGSTYKNLADMQTNFHSAGWIMGGTITDAGGATINISAGKGYVRDDNSTTATLYNFDWTALSGQTIPVNSIAYVGVSYAQASASIVVRSSENWNNKTDFPLGKVINESGTLHIHSDVFGVGDHAANMVNRDYQTMPLARDEKAGGITLGETGTRNVTVSTGALWDRLNRYTISAIDTSGTGTFDSYYRNGSGSFTKVASQTQYPNTQYDDGTGVLATMTNNRYANLWFYIEADGHLVMLYGRNEYTSLSGAEAEGVPATVPNRITASGRIIGRIIFQKSAGTASEIQSAFTTEFNPTSVTDHGNLAGLSDDDHTQYFLANGTRAITGNVDAGNNNISNVSTLTATNAQIANTATAAIVSVSNYVSAPIVNVVGESTDSRYIRANNTSAYNSYIFPNAPLAYASGQVVAINDGGRLEFRDDKNTGGSGAPADAQYVTLALNGTLTAERVLTGTANRISIADGGANGNVTLSTPQNINTNSDVQFNSILTTGTATVNNINVNNTASASIVRATNTATAPIVQATTRYDVGNGIVGTMQMSGSNLFFYDPTTGGKTLAELATDTTGTASAPIVLVGGQFRLSKIAPLYTNGSGQLYIGDSDTVNKGIASFANGNFSVSGGAVSIKTGGVGATELASTAVTAGSYTSTDITVDADGRITSASSGSGGGISDQDYNDMMASNGLQEIKGIRHAVSAYDEFGNSAVDGFSTSGGIGSGSNYTYTGASSYDVAMTAGTIDSFVKLMLHCNGVDGSTTFTDSSDDVVAVTANGNAQIDTAQSQFGGASGLFDGNDYLSALDSASWAFGSGAFTIDCWVRPNVTWTGYNTLYEQYVDGTHYFTIYLRDSGTGASYWQVQDGGSTILNASFNQAFAANTWYHLEFARSGDTGYLFVDGTSVALTGGTFVGAVPDLAAGITIGDGTVTTGLDGWIDEFRLSKGIARHTTNFTAPSAEYAKITSGYVQSISYNASAVPTKMGCVLYLDQNASSDNIAVGLSRDGGVNFATPSMVQIGTTSSGKAYYKSSTLVSVSGQGSATSPVVRVQWLNSDTSDLQGVSTYWK